MLENYFWQKNAGNLLSLKSKQTIEDSKQKREIINLVVDYMLESFGTDISIFQKCMTAFATVTLFPALKYKGSQDGTVSYQYLQRLSLQLPLLF